MNEKEIVLKMYQNVDMGIVGIDAIISQVQDKKLRRLIQSQRKEYELLKKILKNFVKSIKLSMLS